MTRWIVVAGAIGAGKTTAVLDAVERLDAQGMTCLGIAGIPVLDDAGRRVGLDARDLGTGHRRRLARFVGEGGQICPAYEFHARAFNWARRVLRGAIAASPDILVLDELGPMELRHGLGYAPIFDALLQGPVKQVLVVVREPLLPALLERLFGHEVKVLHLTPQNRDDIPGQILEAALGAGEC